MSQLTPKQQRIFVERKRRWVKSIVEHLQHIAKSKHPRQTSFNAIRENLTKLEVLHSDSGKQWLTAEQVFWEKMNIDRFLEKTNLCTKDHLTACHRGRRSYSERMKEVIVNYLKDSEL